MSLKALESSLDRRRDGTRVPVHLEPGEPAHPIAERVQLELALVIVLEGLITAMGAQPSVSTTEPLLGARGSRR